MWAMMVLGDLRGFFTVGSFHAFTVVSQGRQLSSGAVLTRFLGILFLGYSCL
jgi:hypothetical protein